jgi:hypothetical protein
VAFGFLGRRRRGPRRDRGGLVAPPEARLPHERDEASQRPVHPREKLKQAADDEQSGRQDTEARWRATEEFGRNAPAQRDKRPPPVITRKRYRI